MIQWLHTLHLHTTWKCQKKGVLHISHLIFENATKQIVHPNWKRCSKRSQNAFLTILSLSLFTRLARSTVLSQMASNLKLHLYEALSSLIKKCFLCRQVIMEAALSVDCPSNPREMENAQQEDQVNPQRCTLFNYWTNHSTEKDSWLMNSVDGSPFQSILGSSYYYLLLLSMDGPLRLSL